MSYEVVPVSSAKQVIRELEYQEQQRLAASLRSELTGRVGPQTVRINPVTPGGEYYATILSVGYIAVYRQMTRVELKDRSVGAGYYLFDLIAVNEAYG